MKFNTHRFWIDCDDGFGDLSAARRASLRFPESRPTSDLNVPDFSCKMIGATFQLRRSSSYERLQCAPCTPVPGLIQQWEQWSEPQRSVKPPSSNTVRKFTPACASSRCCSPANHRFGQKSCHHMMLNLLENPHHRNHRRERNSKEPPAVGIRLSPQPQLPKNGVNRASSRHLLHH